MSRYFGAEVISVCSTANIELVRSLGAETIIDYTKENVYSKLGYYDVIFDTVGKGSYSEMIKNLNKKGTLILSAGGLSQIIRGIWTSLTSKRKVVSGIMKETPQNMLFIKELSESEKLKPVIDRTYPLAQIADAHSYVEEGHKKGNVVIDVGGE